jgi:hypothetical protein
MGLPVPTVWNVQQIADRWGRTVRMPTIEETEAGMDTMFIILNGLRQKSPADVKAYMLAKAAEMAATINEQRLQMSLQLSNSLSWPFMTILVSWACLLLRRLLSKYSMAFTELPVRL